MADKVTLSLDPDTLARARAAAERDGLALAAWVDRAVRREALRAAAREHEAWLAAHPEVRDELDAFDRYADRVDAGWSDLAGAA
ncbi:hypothetical protein O7626_14250 [Micromonospora sp. WMMD1102]|uniref:hypothetical protein n=1 Tax=Micromonosporaceae TaxID=28056 RepID=UPI0024157965|nr:hypothetical protein [Micromonospora sp. WMMD1102]MDG4787077.1 hypothetical protein [Micromonospora sp. WMMD1102]